MIVKVKKDVFRKFPKLKVAFLLVQGIDNKKMLKESKHLLREVEDLIRLTFNKETVKTHHLIAPWKVAQQEFGKDAQHYHTSVERLLKKVLSRKSVAANDTLTNLLRYLALKHLVPFGLDDTEKMEGNLSFEIAQRKERLNILKNLQAGMLYYRDNKGILGTKMDYWKSSRTALSKKTTSALLHFEILPPINQNKQAALLKDVQDLLNSFCGGELTLFILDQKNNSRKV